MIEKLAAIAYAVLAVIGALAALCAVLAKYLPAGRAKDIARDLGFRLGDAYGVLAALLASFAPKAPAAPADKKEGNDGQ